jgi:hypothetical protein
MAYITSLQLFRFEEISNTFQREFSTLYDFSWGMWASIESAATFSNDVFIAHNHNTYYFKKDYKEIKEGGDEKDKV